MNTDKTVTSDVVYCIAYAEGEIDSDFGYFATREEAEAFVAITNDPRLAEYKAEMQRYSEAEEKYEAEKVKARAIEQFLQIAEPGDELHTLVSHRTGETPIAVKGDG